MEDEGVADHAEAIRKMTLVRPEERKRLEDVVAELKECDNRFSIPYMLADIAQIFDRHGLSDIEGGSTLLQSSKIYVAREARKAIPTILHIHDALRARGCAEENPLRYNDDDNSAFHLPHESRKVFCNTSQNLNIIFILEEGMMYDWSGFPPSSRWPLELGWNVHVRRYWDAFDIEDEFHVEDFCEGDGLSLPIHQAIIRAKSLSEYSDHLEGNEYVYRPDLQWYKDKEFALEHDGSLPSKYRSYGDGRDPGFVLTTAERDHHSPRLTPHAFFDLECLRMELGREP